uniref:ATP synthase F0 subunit 8 n=1 Tax=Amblyomma naponense TaxID=251387 RepID=UPI002E7A3920|nr:ATP synthase F0 subunit 8 [Amblyomma naponense]WQF68994.1 ATP synthase F0 subunit 8 [Amblyomma naponense]
MPQLFPMNWIFLTFLMIISTTIMISAIYFNKISNKILLQNNKQMNKFSMQIKW